jgi:hypothetical protein
VPICRRRRCDSRWLDNASVSAACWRNIANRRLCRMAGAAGSSTVVMLTVPRDYWWPQRCKTQFILVSSAGQTTIVQTVIAPQHATAMTSIDVKGCGVAVCTTFPPIFVIQRYFGTPSWYTCLDGGYRFTEAAARLNRAAVGDCKEPLCQLGYWDVN